MKRFLYLSSKDVEKIINNNFDMIVNAVKDAVMMMSRGTTIQPDKCSQVFDNDYQNRINCMPSTLMEERTSGVKWVSVFPSNESKDLKNVEGFTMLSEIDTGTLKCIMNATDCTSLRTAAIGAIASEFLAKENSESIGFIGAGQEARAHLRLIKFLKPTIKTCFVSSRTSISTARFIEELQTGYDDIKFVDCQNNFERAVVNADIIVTAISSQEKVLKADWIKKGALYIHVAGLEDEFDVAKKADKIICDSWECVKHRTQTIAQMYNAGMLEDKDIYGDIGEILNGQKKGRVSDDEFIYFNSVGLSVEDVLLSNRIYQLALNENIGTWMTK